MPLLPSSPRPLVAIVVALMVTLLGLVAAAPASATEVTAADKRKAVALSVLASDALKQKDFAASSTYYKQAWRADPSIHGYLYSAARAAQKGGDLKTAGEDYRFFLKLPMIPEKLRKLAEKHLAEVDAGLTGASAAGQAGKNPGNTDASATDTPSKAENKGSSGGDGAKEPGTSASAGGNAANASATVGKNADGGSSIVPISLLGAGGLALIGGAVVYLGASSDRAALDDKIPPADFIGTPAITFEDAQTEADRIAGRKTMAAVMAGVGVAAAGVGAWLLLSNDTGDGHTTRIAPWMNGSGLTLTVAF